MIMNRFLRTAPLLIATMALAGVAVGVTTTSTANAAGLRNCVDIAGPQTGRAGCYELVWADGTEYRMTFSNTQFAGDTPKELPPFYVLAPQSERPQGAPPNTFAHDHVVRGVPPQNHGHYNVQMQGLFVLCSGQGMVSGACEASWTTGPGPEPLPFAKTVNGQPLTSTEAIESAAAAGNVALINLGPGAVIVGAITRSN